MTSLRMRPMAVLVAVATLTLTACGGSTTTSSESGTLPETADFAPASAAFFVSVDSDTTGDQWHKAGVLLDRFPSSDKLFAEINEELAKDDVTWAQVKPTLGPEVGVAGLTTEGSSVVMFTKSPKPDDLKALLAKGSDPAVSRVVDGWLVAADTTAAIDRFIGARANGTLADSSDFTDAVGGVDLDGVALAYVPGTTIQTAVDKGLRDKGAPSSLGDVGKVQSLAASATAEDQGISFDVQVLGANLGSVESFNPSLDESFPAKPLFFVTAAGLDKVLRQGLDQIQENDPNFAQQRTQIERALGLTLEGDVLPLFSKEVGLGVYGEASGAGIPVTVDAILTLDDEAKARHLMERLGALLELGGYGTTAKVEVGGLQATEIRFKGEDFSLLWVVDSGKLWISTSKAGLETLLGATNRLADDPAYRSQLDAADVPDEVTSLLYADLQTAVPFVLDFAGDDVDAETRANLKPLRSVVASSSQHGDTVHVGGLVGIG
jgi:Protein of unknown function (DUF3352)